MSETSTGSCNISPFDTPAVGPLGLSDRSPLKGDRIQMSSLELPHSMVLSNDISSLPDAPIIPDLTLVTPPQNPRGLVAVTPQSEIDRVRRPRLPSISPSSPAGLAASVALSIDGMAGGGPDSGHDSGVDIINSNGSTGYGSVTSGINSTTGGSNSGTNTTSTIVTSSGGGYSATTSSIASTSNSITENGNIVVVGGASVSSTVEPSNNPASRSGDVLALARHLETVMREEYRLEAEYNRLEEELLERDPNATIPPRLPVVDEYALLNAVNGDENRCMDVLQDLLCNRRGEIMERLKLAAIRKDCASFVVETEDFKLLIRNFHFNGLRLVAIQACNFARQLIDLGLAHDIGPTHYESVLNVQSNIAPFSNASLNPTTSTGLTTSVNVAPQSTHPEQISALTINVLPPHSMGVAEPMSTASSAGSLLVSPTASQEQTLLPAGIAMTTDESESRTQGLLSLPTPSSSVVTEGTTVVRVARKAKRRRPKVMPYLPLPPSCSYESCFLKYLVKYDELYNNESIYDLEKPTKPPLDTTLTSFYSSSSQYSGSSNAEGDVSGSESSGMECLPRRRSSIISIAIDEQDSDVVSPLGQSMDDNVSAVPTKSRQVYCGAPYYSPASGHSPLHIRQIPPKCLGSLHSAVREAHIKAAAAAQAEVSLYNLESTLAKNLEAKESQNDGQHPAALSHEELAALAEARDAAKKATREVMHASITVEMKAAAAPQPALGPADLMYWVEEFDFEFQRLELWLMLRQYIARTCEAAGPLGVHYPAPADDLRELMQRLQVEWSPAPPFSPQQFYYPYPGQMLPNDNIIGPDFAAPPPSIPDESAALPSIPSTYSSLNSDFPAPPASQISLSANPVEITLNNPEQSLMQNSWAPIAPQGDVESYSIAIQDQLHPPSTHGSPASPLWHPPADKPWLDFSKPPTTEPAVFSPTNVADTSCLDESVNFALSLPGQPSDRTSSAKTESLFDPVPPSDASASIAYESASRLHPEPLSDSQNLNLDQLHTSPVEVSIGLHSNPLQPDGHTSAVATNDAVIHLTTPRKLDVPADASITTTSDVNLLQESPNVTPSPVQPIPDAVQNESYPETSTVVTKPSSGPFSRRMSQSLTYIPGSSRGDTNPSTTDRDSCLDESHLCDEVDHDFDAKSQQRTSPYSGIDRTLSMPTCLVPKSSLLDPDVRISQETDEPSCVVSEEKRSSEEAVTSVTQVTRDHLRDPQLSLFELRPVPPALVTAESRAEVEKELRDAGSNVLDILYGL